MSDRAPNAPYLTESKTLMTGGDDEIRRVDQIQAHSAYGDDTENTDPHDDDTAVEALKLKIVQSAPETNSSSSSTVRNYIDTATDEVVEIRKIINQLNFDEADYFVDKSVRPRRRVSYPPLDEPPTLYDEFSKLNSETVIQLRLLDKQVQTTATTTTTNQQRSSDQTTRTRVLCVLIVVVIILLLIDLLTRVASFPVSDEVFE